MIIAKIKCYASMISIIIKSILLNLYVNNIVKYINNKCIVCSICL